VTPRALAKVAATAAALGLASACATGGGAVDFAQMGDAPVAIVYRDESLALKRLDALNDLEKRNRPSDVEGVVRVETLDGMFGGAPDVQRRLREVYGHLALFHPKSSEVENVPGLPPGAKPLGWSPDRSRLLLAGRFRDLTQLFIWERATGELAIATSGESEHPLGCIGANGRLVAVEARRSAGGWDARLLATPAGSLSGLRPATNGPAEIFPTCSPTEPLVAYVTSDENGVLSIAVIDLEAPDAAPHLIGRGEEPVFTPDGAWIVYSGPTTRGKRLFRVRPDGTGRTPIGTEGEEDVDEKRPAVSPDGAYVAYIATDFEKRERLRVRRFDGSGDRPFLTEGDADFPVW
jgi:hypothetical protein